MTRSKTRTPLAQNRPNFIVAARGVSRNGRPMVPASAVQAKKAILNARARAHLIFGSRLGQRAPAPRKRDEQGMLDIYHIRSPAAPRFLAAPTNARARPRRERPDAGRFRSRAWLARIRGDCAACDTRR